MLPKITSTALYVNGDDQEYIGSQDTMDINVIILMFPNPTFSGNMVTSKACSQWATGKVKLLIDGAAKVQEDNGANISYNLFQNFQPFFALYIIYRKLS